MKTCYLTGKMRGVPCLNFPQFNFATRLLRAAGWKVLSPVEMDHEAREPWTDHENPDWADEKFKISDADCRRLIRRDVDAILSLRRKSGDAIVCLPDWREGSTGAFGEGGVGRWAMIPMYELEMMNGSFRLRKVADTEWGAKADLRSYSEQELFLKINPVLRQFVRAQHNEYVLEGTRSFISEKIAAAIIEKN